MVAITEKFRIQPAKKDEERVQRSDVDAVVRRNFGCWIGLHNWYYGSFSFPVWGRIERHCLDCPKKQHREYHKNKKSTWKTFAA